MGGTIFPTSPLPSTGPWVHRADCALASGNSCREHRRSKVEEEEDKNLTYEKSTDFMALS